MKKSYYLIPFISLALILSGCILSKSPSTDSVSMNLGDHQVFSVKIFPSKAVYTWTLDGAALPNTGNSFIYTAQAGQHFLTVRAKHSLGTDTQSWDITTFNTAPVASAGPDQTVSVNTNVTLNGSGSFDQDNNIVSYQWQQIDGPSVELNNAYTAIANFTASVAIGSTLTFRLIIIDADGLQSTDTCSVTVEQLNHNPIANAGPDQSVIANATVVLNGSGSFDPDNNIVSYQWQQIYGPSVTLNDADTAIASFTASVESDSTLLFMLTVTDADGLQSTDTCSVTVPQPNQSPVANAGPDQSVSVNSTVTLYGAGSTDPNNDIVSYHWQQKSGTYPYVTLTNAETAIAQFTATVPIGRVLTFELTVTDATGLQSTDSCDVSVSVISSPITDLLNSMIYLPAGTFMMGREGEYAATPVHQVNVQGFGIGAYEVTQAQYKAVMGENPSYYQGPSYPNSENRPVELVSWDNAREFCAALSAVTGRNFTLPSEAQWEYACRAGSDTLFSFGDDDSLLGNYAWYILNSGNQTHYVGTKLPNAWGLYDMHGNVSEWCLDSWHEDYTGAPSDGSAWEPDAGIDRVLRDNSFAFSASDLHLARRTYSHQYTGTNSWGFRIVEIP